LKQKTTEVHYDFHPEIEVSETVPKLVSAYNGRVGVYAGAFDPVHAGHIKFALEAQKQVKLDHIHFVAERSPGRGAEPEHYVHRSAMLAQALRPYAQFSVFDLPDAQLTLRSLARINTSHAEVYILTSASQLLWSRGALPALYRSRNLVVAVTADAQMAEVLERLSSGGRSLGNVMFVNIGTGHISSAVIRHGLRQRQLVRGLLPSVWRYARKQWLYLPPIHRM
jgi:nicotinic acid mononucleotide adenylyltransferase